MYMLAKKFDFKYPKSTAVETIDHYLLNWEWNNIMLKKKPTHRYPLIKILTPKQAKTAFLKAYRDCQVMKVTGELRF